MKNKKIRHIKETNDDTKEVKTLLIITLIIIVVAVGLYFLADSSLSKKKSEERTEATINYSEIMIGTMFSRPYSEYYVFAYKNDDENASKFDNLYTKYDDKEDNPKIYFIDLANSFNESVLSDVSNKKPVKAEDVKIKNYALILVKNGKVAKYYETVEEIEKALS